MLAQADAQLRHLSPSYFALVMATGVVSLGAQLLGLPLMAMALFVINIGAYVALWRGRASSVRRRS